MIHTLLNLTRPLIVLDTETTGVDTQKDRIVEIGFQLWTAEGMQKEWRSLVNPGIPIPPEVTEIHGITDAMMRLCQICGRPRGEHPSEEWDDESAIETIFKRLPDATRDEVVDLFESCKAYKVVPHFKQIAANLAKGFTDCDFAGKNVRFDLRITAAEMARERVDWSYYGARIIDAERIEQLLVPRSLSHLHKKYAGHKHDGAHGALSDVRASTTVIVGQLHTARGQTTHTYDRPLPSDLDELHALQWPGWIDGEGKFKFVNGVPCFSQWGKYSGKPMRSADASYWDFIIAKDFSADVKALARAAKLGQYPIEAPQRPGEASEMRRE